MNAGADSLSAWPRRTKRSVGWTATAFLIATPAIVSLAIVAASVLRPDPQLVHVLQYVLPRVSLNTVTLVIGVGTLATVLGVSLAWLTAIYEFPGRRFFTWALLLPMAVPGYVIAFVAIGMLDYAGPLQGLLREWTGNATVLPPIRSRGGVIVVMSLALYPYVYLLARNGFLTQGPQALEIAQSLGLSRRQGFVRVALPLARPWIAGGATLVVMETLADFGTVSVFNYDTFTTAIYKSWFSLFSIDAALQLAFFLLLFVALALAGERRLRGRAAFTTRLAPPAARVRLGRSGRWLAAGFAAAVLSLGFVLPALQLSLWSAVHLASEFDSQYLVSVMRTLTLAVVAALTIGAAATLMAYALRLSPTRGTRAAARIATLGYALPGTVLAVGVYSQLSYLNGLLNEFLQWSGAPVPSLFLQGTVLAMLLGLGVRFLSVAFQSVDAAMQRITPQLDEVAQSLGVTGAMRFRTVHAPLLRGGLATALVLVFVDVMKEMPITLMTRPFGWDTLAVHVYELTAEGQWEQAALPALTIVAVGLVPVILITRASTRAVAAR